MAKRVRVRIRKPGVYVMTNPVGEVYVGQTINLKARESQHRGFAKGVKNRHRLLSESLIKYGFDAHNFTIVRELSPTASSKDLKSAEYEVYAGYVKSGCRMLNVLEAGTEKIIEDGAKEAISMRSKSMWTDEFRQNHIDKRIGKQIHSDEEKKKRSEWMKNNRQILGENRKFTKEDCEKGVAAIREKMVKFGYLVPPESMEIGRQKKSRIILNTQTGIFYFGSREAACSVGDTEGNLRKKLKGQYKNNTSLIYV